MLVARVRAGVSLAKPLSNIIHRYNWLLAQIVEPRAREFVGSPAECKLPLFRHRIVMDVFQLLTQEARTVYVLRLHRLPDLVLFSSIGLPMLRKEPQVFSETIFLKLFQNIRV